MQIEMLLAQKKPKISAAKSKPCGKGKVQLLPLPFVKLP